MNYSIGSNDREAPELSNYDFDRRIGRNNNRSEVSMNYFPHSPIEVPRGDNGLIASDKESLAEFWTKVDKELEDGLSDATGCYIFSVRAAKGALPWYVGLAERQSFRRECFTSHKIVHYNNVVADRKGTPLLTLIAKYTPSGRLSGPISSEQRDIQFLETMLISCCLARNSELYNIKDTKLLREMVVPGLLNTPQGKSNSSVLDFRALIGM